MRQTLKVRGMVTVRVLDGDGNIKREAPGLLRRLLGLPGRLMEFRHHNIVTREGDALIADALLPAPAKPKVTGETGYIQLGTGWTGNSVKTNTRCNTPTTVDCTTASKPLDSGYPVLKAAWGQEGDNTVIYRTTFTTGQLNANGINEACLLNGDEGTAQCLAYAQIIPAVNITAADTLQVVWELTITGQ
jgi:hypothetical protein